MAQLAEGTARDGLPVPALVAQMRAAIDDSDGDAVHRGATSQDVMDTGFVLAALAGLDVLSHRIAGVLSAIDALDAQFGSRTVMARTRMQAALPIAVAERLDGWRRSFNGHQDALADLRATLGRVQVGGPVGVRSDLLQRIAPLVAAKLGLSEGPVWQTERSCMVDLGNWLTKLAGTSGKVGQDVGLMAQQGIDEVRLRGAGGSSAMPHKKNPIRAEVAVALAQHVAGMNGTLGLAMLHENERSGAAWMLEWLTLPAMFEACGASMASVHLLLSQIEDIGRAASAGDP
jgi:3-carboxy-cis,cis-muconate cycloisomerase